MLSRKAVRTLNQSCGYLQCADSKQALLLCARSLATGTDELASRASKQPLSDGRLYATHEPLGPLQKGAVAVLSAIGAALSPKRADLVAALGETTGRAAFWNLQRRMQQSPTGRRILEDRPRITDEVLAAAASQAPGTFGHAYGRFMGRRHFRADERPPVRFVDDVQLAYVAQRAREVHDLWHVLFGCHTTVLGELALKALEFVQTGLPMAALSVAGAQWRLTPAERMQLNTQLLPWALRAGNLSTDLMCLYYEEHFKEDIELLRQRWHIIPAPLSTPAGPVFSRPTSQPQLHA